MQHRDFIVLQKILSEISIGTDMLGDTTLTDFLDNEMLKRALSMTTINIGELVKNLTSDLKDMFQNDGRTVHKFYGIIYANKENGKLESNKRMWLYEKIHISILGNRVSVTYSKEV